MAATMRSINRNVKNIAFSLISYTTNRRAKDYPLFMKSYAA